MTAILKLIPWWAYAFAVLLLIIGWQALKVHHYKSAEATYKSSVSVYESAQATNLGTIQTLTAANTKWAEQADDAQANAKVYAAAIAEYQMQQQHQSAAVTSKLKVYYASHPLARAWSATAVDPGVAEQLRANAGSAH